MGQSHKFIIHDEGKIDIHQRQLNFERAQAKLEKAFGMNQDNRKLILNFIRDCTLGKTIIGKSKKKIGPARCKKYIRILQQLSNWFDKSFEEVNQIDMEKLIEKLEINSIKSVKQKPYSEATKVDIKRTIKKFWKWKDGNNRVYPELVEWIDTYETMKDVPALTKLEVEKLIEFTSNSRDKALQMVLFDSGARVEELLNVRLKPEHLQWKEDIGCYKIRLEFSKTKPRTISLPLSTDILKVWLDAHPAKNNGQAQLFPVTYGNLRMLIKRIGLRVLGKRVTPHILRHSSATFYANKLNRYQLCYRYGWTMSSRVVDRYLDREGILEGEMPGLIKADEILSVKKEKQELQEDMTLLKESYSEIAEQLAEVKGKLKSLEDGKGVMPLLLSLKQKQGEMAKSLKEHFGDKFDLVLPMGKNVKRQRIERGQDSKR